VEKALQTVVPPEDFAGIIIEPIAGEGGYIIPPDGFLVGLREICDRHGALLIADEVQSGIGRTGKMFAVEHWDVDPDILCLAKALGGGLPLGAILARVELIDAWPPAAHGTTFGGNPVACRAGITSLQIIQEEKLMDNAIHVGDYIQNRFREAQTDLPMIGDVRGKGLMVAAELVNADGSPASEIIKEIIKEMGSRGIVLTKCGASALRFAPPLIINQEQVDHGVEIILDLIREHQW
jgi:4-aminobutyrate aminotransferase